MESLQLAGRYARNTACLNQPSSSAITQKLLLLEVTEVY